MGYQFIRWVVLAVTLVPVPPRSQAKDPRYAPISEGELTAQIARPQPRSEEHLALISRAAYAGLGKAAYAEYTRLCRAAPRDAYALLHRGFAALQLWDYLSDTDMRAAEPYRAMVRDCLSQAAALAPTSPTIQREYGFYMWQFGGKMAEGLAALCSAARRLPNDARAHELLGNIHSNKAGNAYDPQEAVRELREAMRLDPAYARPHWLLGLLYASTNRLDRARAEVDAYLRLMPAGAGERPRIKPVLAWLRRSA